MSTTTTKPRSPAPAKAAISKAEPEHTYHDVQTFLQWEAPNRPFKTHSREYYINSLLIMLAIEVILFLFSEYLLMLVVLALVFVLFTLITIPPHESKYRISSEGIGVDEYYYLWKELYDFYFVHRFGEEQLVIRTEAFFPGELVIMLGNHDKETVKRLLLHFLPYREYVKKPFMEKSADWLAKTFPLEKTHS